MVRLPMYLVVVMLGGTLTFQTYASRVCTLLPRKYRCYSNQTAEYCGMQHICQQEWQVTTDKDHSPQALNPLDEFLVNNQKSMNLALIKYPLLAARINFRREIAHNKTMNVTTITPPMMASTEYMWWSAGDELT